MLPFTERSFRYSAFGLSIESDFYLPEMFESDDSDDPDVKISRVEDLGDQVLPKSYSSFDRPGCTVNIAPAYVSYNWTGLGTVIVRGGQEVLVKLAPNAADDDLTPFLTGAVLGNLLEQRGKMVLHGSALGKEGFGIAFLGEKGAGKSTLALYLEMNGFQLITDDLLPVTVAGGQVQTLPGCQQIKVWPDSALSVGLKPEAMPKISKFVDKRSYKCPTGTSNLPARLDRIYVLSEEPETRIERLDPSAAFIELTRHAYIVRYLQATGRFAAHFNDASAIVASIPIFRLGRPHDFDRLPDVYRELSEHINTSQESISA